MRAKTTEDGRHLIGHVWVDSGQIVVVDPCYLDEWVADAFDYDETCCEPRFSYNGSCAVTCGRVREGEQAGQLEHGAVASRTAWGDGVYPAYVDVRGGRVVRLSVEFDD